MLINVFVRPVWSNNVVPYSTAKEACTEEGYVGPYKVHGEVVTTEFMDELCTKSREIWKIFGHMTQSVEMSPSETLSTMTRTITVEGEAAEEGEEGAPDENNNEDEGGADEEGPQEANTDQDLSDSEVPDPEDADMSDDGKYSSSMKLARMMD